MFIKGKILWVHFQSLPRPGANGDVLWMGTLYDISERKQVEEALRESEVRFRELFNRMSSGVAVYEAADDGGDFIIRDFNPAAEKIEKVSREDIIGKRVSEVFPGVKAFGVFKVFQRVWQTGEAEYFPENIYKDERDSESWRESWVFKLPTGEIVTIYNDVTERKQDEAALQKSEMKLKAMMDNSPVVILLIQEGKLIYVNPAAESTTGWQEEEFIGKNFTSFVHKDDMEIVIKKNRERMGGNSFLAPYVLRITKKTGGFIYAEVNGTVIDLDGKPTMLGFLTDITERKRVEEEVGSQLGELQRWQEIMLGREDRVLELKAEVNELCRRAGEKPRYSSQETGPADPVTTEVKP